ncbi:MAG TPA: DUF4240 domain-containing protein [Chthonomonadaceae bacterium]|nr:DUF4240 domain-containing protein [Chthonomonadaceae bacterium]
MDEDEFWKTVNGSREAARAIPRRPSEDFIAVHERTLADALKRLSPEEVAGFEWRFREASRRAYRWGLWAAAYWLCGGCSDDGFTDFRACLISLGRAAYESALHDPDSLADVVALPGAPYMQAEGFQYVASRVYESMTGSSSIPHDPHTL